MIRELSIHAPEAAEAAPPGATDVPNPVWSTRLARPGHPVLEDHGLVWRGSELAASVTGLAGRLARGGVRPGETVALCGPPSPEWIIAFHALGWLGAAVAPIAPGAAREELAAALELTGAERVFVAHGLTRPEREALEAVAPHARYLTSLPLGPAPAERFWPLEEARLVLLTSGTTGRPRPIRLTTAQLVFSAFGSAIRLGHHADDRWLACLPFHHVGGLSILVRCALYGTTVVLHRRFRPAEVARALDAGEATLVSLVPSMLRDVLDARPARPFPPTLRAVLLGGDAAPDDLLARCAELRVPVALTWGMTEAASQVATRAPSDLDARGGGGAPLPFARVFSEGGHLAVRGPLANGVVRTRDRGAIDFAGRVHVSGRAEAFVTSGGETFAAREVEEVLERHPEVAAAAVIPVADARWGERPLAVLVARDPAHRPAEAALREWCRTRLARFKTPDAFAWIEALPRTDLGKLARGQLAARFGRPARRRRRPHAPPPPPAPLPRPAPDVLARLLAAAERFGPSAFAGRVEAAEAALGEDLLALEAEVAARAERLPGPPELRARQAALTLVGIPGKRLRPLCTLLAARLAGRAPDRGTLAAAAACELIHTATLLHDDVVDEAVQRRGAPAARVVWGNSASILAGDYLFAEALRAVGPLGEGELLPRLLEVIAEMAVAEALQLERRGRVEPDLDVCLRIVRGKTAALFRWALWAGGRLGGLPPDGCAALGRAGDALGTAFQLADDLLDLAGDPAAIGKDALADVRQGKLTWPLALAVRADPELGRALAALASEDGEDGEALAARATPLLARVHASDALARTRELAEREADRARRELASLPEGWPRALLETIVTLAVRRGA